MLKAIKLLLFFTALLVFLIFFSLFFGIKINSFSLANVSVSQFYLKLDKKLILTVENVILNDKETQSASTFEDIKKDLQFFPKILHYFKSIDIENLALANNRFTIKLEDNYLYLDNKFLNLATSFEHSSSNTKFDLYSLYLKEQDMLLDGKIDINYLNDEIKYDGKFFLNDVISNLKINANRKNVDFYVDSNYFENLHFLKPYLKDIDQNAKEWMYENVLGPIKLNQFTGKYDLIKNELDLNSLNGKATIKKAQITFHKDVETIKTSKIDVTFNNGNLTFILDNPTFKDISIDGSFVKIENLASNENGKVIVHIKTNHRLDDKIQSILKAFNIHIPLIQKDGSTNAHLILDIPYSHPMKTYGEFKITDSNISINNSFDFYSKSADVKLDGSVVKIKNADFKHKDMIDANINLDIDTNSLKAVGNTNIKQIFIKSDTNEIINLQNKTSKLDLDFNDDVNINLPNLDVYLSIDDLINIDIKDLSKLVSSSQLLKENSIENGNLLIKIKDFENMKFDGVVYGNELQLYSKEENQNNKTKKLLLNGLIDNSVTKISFEDIYLKNKNDIYDVKKGSVEILANDINFNAKVQNLDIPLKKNNELVKTLDLKGRLNKESLKIESEDKSIIYETNENDEYAKVYLKGYDVLINTKDDEKKEIVKYKIDADNTNLVINDKYKFLADKINATIDEDIILDLKYLNSEIKFEDINNKNMILATNLNDDYLNTIFSKEIFLGGMMDIEANGKNYELEGKIKLTTSTIKDLAFINNLITFVNTSPALLNPLLAIPSLIDMVNNDGFNLNGYAINKGNVSFKYSPINNMILVKDLTTIGNSVDFEGNGIINLQNDELDMNLYLIFLKGYSNIVKHIPLVNYLLLGKNNRIDTNVRIIGDISDPQVETNFIKEGVNAPFNFAKRILNTPMNLYDSITGNSEEEK